MTTSNNTVDLNAQGWYLDSSPTPLLGTWNNQSNEVIVNTNDPTAVQVKSNDTVNTGKGKDVISGTATNNTAQDVYGVLIAGTLNASGGNDSITGNATGTQFVNGILVTGILNTGTGNDNITGIAYGSNQLNSNQVFGIRNNNQINLRSGNNNLIGIAKSTDVGNTNAEVLANGAYNVTSYGIGNKANKDSSGNLIGDGSSSITAGDGNNLIEGNGTVNGTLAVTSDINNTSPNFISVGIQESSDAPHSITVGNGNNKIIGNATVSVSPSSSTPLSVQYSNLAGYDFGININPGDSIQTGNGSNEITGNAIATMANFVDSNPSDSFYTSAEGILDRYKITTGTGNNVVTGNATTNITAQGNNINPNGSSNYATGIDVRGEPGVAATLDVKNGQINGNATLISTSAHSFVSGNPISTDDQNNLYPTDNDQAEGILTNSYGSINLVHGNINGTATVKLANVSTDPKVYYYSALIQGIVNYGITNLAQGNITGTATVSANNSSPIAVYGIFNTTQKDQWHNPGPGKITLVDGDIIGTADATVTSPVASVNPTQVDGIYNTGTISITGDKNDSITGTGSTYGIYNSGTINLTGKGNDTVIANGGFGGNGIIKLGSGKDAVIGFGNQTVIGGGGTDTLKLLSGTYTVGSANTSNGINGSFTTLSSNGATMYLEGFTNLVVGNKSFNFNNLGSTVTG